MFGVFEKRVSGRWFIKLFLNEIDAIDFCEEHGWWMPDESGEVFELDYSAV